MKNLVFYLVIFVFGVFFVSCESDATKQESEPILQFEENQLILKKGSNFLYSNTELSKLASGGVGVVCRGGCDCQVWIDLDTYQGGCTCDDCVMDLTFKDELTDYNGFDKTKAIKSLFSIPLYEVAAKDLVKYAREKYNTEIKGFNEVGFVIKENLHIITFNFTDNNGKEQSVLYSNNIGSETASKVADRRFRVDCRGGCGCREQFDFNTNTASCSCSECTMTITELEAAG